MINVKRGERERVHVGIYREVNIPVLNLKISQSNTPASFIPREKMNRGFFPPLPQKPPPPTSFWEAYISGLASIGLCGLFAKVFTAAAFAAATPRVCPTQTKRYLSQFRLRHQNSPLYFAWPRSTMTRPMW